MSQLSRLLSRSFRLCARRPQIALLARPAATVQQPTLRYAARLARTTPSEFPSRPRKDDAEYLRDYLRTLNEQVQRSGRVLYRTVESAIDCAERLVGSVSSVEMQLLLRATGSFLKETLPSDREKLSNKVWDLTPKDRLDISHYNTLLQVKLENGSEFDPSTFLQELSDAQISPNRVTYQRLVQRYCEMGDLPSATKIIEFMKSQEMAVTERVFNSLIVGHLKTGNPEGARNILNVMESAGLKPSGETYTVLGEGLAQSGDIQGALEVLSKTHLLDEHILRFVRAFALKDDIKAAEQAMEALSDATVNYSDVNSICIELIVMRKPDMATQIYKRAQVNSVRRDGGNFIPLCAARAGYPASAVLRICEQLKELTGEDAFIEAASTVVKSGNKALSEEYIDKMKELGLPVRAHYYLPFLCSASDEAEVFSELKRMSSLGVPSMDLVIDFVLPRVNVSDISKLHARLTECGVPGITASNAMAFHLLRNNRLADAEKLLTEYDVSKMNSLTGFTAGAIRNAEDLPVAIRILSILVQNSEIKYELVARFLENSGPHLNDAIAAIAKTELPLSLKSFNRLRAAGFNVEPLSNQVVDVSEPRRHDDYDIERTTEELEEMLSAAEASGSDTTRLLKKLLNEYCKQRNVEKVEEVLRKLPVDELTAANHSNLVEMFTREEDVERASDYFERAFNRNMNLNPYRALQLAKLLVEKKRLFEASELIEKASANVSLSRESFQIGLPAGHLLLSIFENYGKEACFNFYERYIAKHVNTRSLSMVLKKLIDDNPIEAFDLFKEIAYKYKGAPCRRLLVKRLIQADMTEEIGVMIDVLTGLHGKIDCAVDMAVCYLECGKLTEARDMVAQCSGGRGKANLVRACNFYFDDGKFDLLDTLLGLLEELGVAGDVVSLFRIKQCDRENNFVAALDVWTQAQEDNRILFPAAMQILAELLERNEQPVPFVVPEVEDELSSGLLKTSIFRTMIERSLDEALEYRKKLKAESKKLNLSDMCVLIHELVNKEKLELAFEVVGDLEDISGLEGRIKAALSRLLDVAASKGMVTEIGAFVESSGGFGSAALQRAYLVSGRLEELVTQLENQPVQDHRFTITEDWMKADPAIAARLENLAHRCASEERNYLLVSQLWYFYVVESELEKALELQNKYPEMGEWLQKTWFPRRLKRRLNRDSFEHFIQATEDREVRQRMLYFTLSELVENKNIAEAVSCLNLGNELGLDTSRFPAWLLARLEPEAAAQDRRQEAESRSS